VPACVACSCSISVEYCCCHADIWGVFHTCIAGERCCDRKGLPVEMRKHVQLPATPTLNVRSPGTTIYIVYSCQEQCRLRRCFVSASSLSCLGIWDLRFESTRSLAHHSCEQCAIGEPPRCRCQPRGRSSSVAESHKMYSRSHGGESGSQTAVHVCSDVARNSQRSNSKYSAWQYQRKNYFTVQ
jgi:hypothetical protein